MTHKTIDHLAHELYENAAIADYQIDVVWPFWNQASNKNRSKYTNIAIKLVENGNYILGKGWKKDFIL